MTAARRPERWFGSPMLFTCETPGRWVFEHDGQRWELEKRRGEPGAPAGWYVYGPGVFGRRAGAHPEDAAELAYGAAAMTTTDHKLIRHGKGEALWGECSCQQWAWLGTYEMPKGRLTKLRAAFAEHVTYEAERQPRGVYDGTAETQYDDMTDDDLRRMHASEARGERGPVHPGLAEPVWGLEQP